ncbi:unnamed protein product [Phytophthora fragariaefolia]|uniref:Unnamed protein product n=1 Tax=Phytophthora fragariaefolia TaxID=1490495 RepID=A0A9W6XP69_9STRA|nr:unnamed protein product [Phytophthora fragariaefolia]
MALILTPNGTRTKSGYSTYCAALVSLCCSICYPTTILGGNEQQQRGQLVAGGAARERDDGAGGRGGRVVGRPVARVPGAGAAGGRLRAARGGRALLAARGAAHRAGGVRVAARVREDAAAAAVLGGVRAAGLVLGLRHGPGAAAGHGRRHTGEHRHAAAGPAAGVARHLLLQLRHLKNIMGGLMTLQDEQIQSGIHVSFQGHEGVVERLFLQGFSLRQYDKGLAYIPNSIMLENSVTVQSKSLDRRCVIPVHLSHSTPTTALRMFIQELDNYLMQHMLNQRTHAKADVLGLEKPQGGWNIMNVYERSKKLATEGTQPQGRFWISIEAPYLVHVVYYSQERHINGLLAEKTEIVLHITELLRKLKLRLHGEEKGCAGAASSTVSSQSSSSESEAPDLSERHSSFSPAPLPELAPSRRRRRAPPASEPLGRPIDTILTTNLRTPRPVSTVCVNPWLAVPGTTRRRDVTPSANAFTSSGVLDRSFSVVASVFRDIVVRSTSQQLPTCVEMVVVAKKTITWLKWV